MKINIRPQSSVYATYERLSYQPWTALAEFIDNSTQSFFDHKDELLNRCGQNCVDIIISQDNENTLSIIDNAFGMEAFDFERAITLDRPPLNTKGRNEYGMGLKTAACWFGKKWTVRTSQLGSPYGYQASIDINKLLKDKDEEIDVDVFEEKVEAHYTEIKIEKLKKKIIGRTSGKVKEFLSNIYRQDIRNNKVRIIYREAELSFQEPTPLKEILPTGEEKVWRQDIAFIVDYEGKPLHVKGFIGIRSVGSLKDAGFTLLRRGRVIIGGPERNYRPNELFGYSNSYAFQRLYGELHMDEWPVTQAKDEFDWHNSGLEESFINELKHFSDPYKEKANAYRKKKQASDIIDNAFETFESAGVISTIAQEETTKIPDEDTTLEEEITPEIENEECITSSSKEIVITGQKTQTRELKYNGTLYTFELIIETESPKIPWLVITPSENNTFILRLNMKHPFFKPFINDENFGTVLMKLAIAMALAELDASMITPDSSGLVEPSEIRNKMNKILEDIASNS